MEYPHRSVRKPPNSTGLRLVKLTSVSLLERLKVARPDASDWNRLHGVYQPLIQSWVSRVPGLGEESIDLAQEVLIVVFREVPRFDRRHEGSFRAWLRQVTINRVRHYCRERRRRPTVGTDAANKFLEQLSDPSNALPAGNRSPSSRPTASSAASAKRRTPPHVQGPRAGVDPAASAGQPSATGPSSLFAKPAADDCWKRGTQRNHRRRANRSWGAVGKPDRDGRATSAGDPRASHLTSGSDTLPMGDGRDRSTHPAAKPLRPSFRNPSNRNRRADHI